MKFTIKSTKTTITIQLEEELSIGDHARLIGRLFHLMEKPLEPTRTDTISLKPSNEEPAYKRDHHEGLLRDQMPNPNYGESENPKGQCH